MSNLVVFYLRSVLEIALEKVRAKKGSAKSPPRRGSKKGLSRRHIEGRNTPFQEYDPLRVHGHADYHLCPNYHWGRKHYIHQKDWREKLFDVTFSGVAASEL